MRALLVQGGMELSEAMSFSCHSWRHLYPTAGRQLDLDPEKIESIGHWAPSAGMAARYDSLACVAELVQKAKVRNALTSGWDMVAPGCVPRQVPCTPPPSSSSSRPTAAKRAAPIKEPFTE